MSELLNKKDAMLLLGITASTLTRWMRSGKIKYTRVEGERFAPAVFFTVDEITRLMPPSSDSEECPTAPPSNLLARPTAPSCKQHERTESRDTRTWAEKYTDGDAPDSCGNFVDGENRLYPSSGATLLGPVEPYNDPPVNRDTTSHMNPALVGRGGPDASAGYLDSLERARDIGTITAVQYATLTSNADKARRQCEQSRKQHVDIATIRAAFRQGFSR